MVSGGCQQLLLAPTVPNVPGIDATYVITLKYVNLRTMDGSWLIDFSIDDNQNHIVVLVPSLV